MKGSSLVDSVLLWHGGMLVQPRCSQRPHSPSQRRALSFPSMTGARQTPQDNLERLAEPFFEAISFLNG